MDMFGDFGWSARLIAALAVTITLIVLAALLMRRFGSAGKAAGMQQPRLSVIDSAAVDGRRKLILVRRDDVEHLLMIGGPGDIVIEPNIVRPTAEPRDNTGPAIAAVAEPVPNVANVAQRLKAALHRPPAGGEPAGAEPPESRSPASLPTHAALDARRTEWQHKPSPGRAPGKQFYQTIEQEMSRLLGRRSNGA